MKNTPCVRVRPAAARGWTLLELLVVVAIAAILLRIAVPGMAGVVHSVQLSAAANAFLASLGLARAEALRRGTRVAMCKSADGATCAASGGWEQGWITFEDGNRNGIPDPGESLIERQQALGTGVVVAGNRPVAEAIAFAPGGSPRGKGGGMQAGTLTLCRLGDGPAAARQIVISNTGRARVRKLDLGDCLY